MHDNIRQEKGKTITSNTIPYTKLQDTQRHDNTRQHKGNTTQYKSLQDKTTQANTRRGIHYQTIYYNTRQCKTI